jgi:ferric-dicitrate binding protein FerR (iron transport regulator)
MITDELLFRFLNQETNNRENRLINLWLAKYPEQLERLNQLKEVSADSPGSGSPEEKISSDWTLIESKFKPVQSADHSRLPRLVQFSRIAAIFLIMIGSAVFWLYRSNTHVVRNNDLYAKSVLLPDGTQVDLGPGSKLVYGKEFMKGKRELRLTGEAFFDVTTDPDHPFTVMAGLAKIKVTGTRFVVNASAISEEVEVSVKSGNVLFYNSDILNENSFRMGLVAGEKGIFYPAQNRMDKTKDPYFQTTP